MEQWVQISLGSVATLVTSGIIGGVVYIRGLRKQLHELDKKCENLAAKESVEALKLQMKDLEAKDALQQQTIDQLNALFPLLTKAMDILEKEKK